MRSKEKTWTNQPVMRKYVGETGAEQCRRGPMPTSQTNRVIAQLRRTLRGDDPDLSDGHLLGRFTQNGDEAAFEALVRRHGPMVLGVCRRVLRSLHDAEDALQATFLVLVRKAASLKTHEAVGNWLYGV